MARSNLEMLMESVSPDPFSGCWLWMGALTKGGYPQTHCRALNERGAHRVIYIYSRGFIPEKQDLDHLCRVRCCVNPYHLEPVSRSENIRRSPRCTGPKCINGHERTTENTYTHNGKRSCVMSMKAAGKRFLKRRRCE